MPALLTIHTDYRPHFVLVRGPVERTRTICFLVQVQALLRETENHYQLKKSSVIYRKRLGAFYPGPVVSYPQPPNRPHNLHLSQQRVLKRQNKPFTLSQWRGVQTLGVPRDCGQDLEN